MIRLASDKLGPHLREQAAPPNHSEVSRVLNPHTQDRCDTGKACDPLPAGRGHGQHDYYRVRDFPTSPEELSRLVVGRRRPGVVKDAKDGPTRWAVMR